MPGSRAFVSRRRKTPFFFPPCPSVWLGAALVLVLTACSAPTLAPVRPFSDAEIAAYRPFLVPGPMLPVRATGAISLRLGGQTESGDFIVTGNSSREFSVQVLARLAGSLVGEIRIDRTRLLLLNYADKTYFGGPNDLAHRTRIMGVDITPDEFLMAFTARVPTEEFAAADGRFTGRGFAEMKKGRVQYRFALDEHGLPKNWVKEVNAKVVIRVEYRAYLLLHGSAGPPLRIPHKIRIYGRGDTPVMVMGVANFFPGATNLKRVVFSPPESSAWSFSVPPDAGERLFKNL